MEGYMEVVANATVEFTGSTKCNDALAAAASKIAAMYAQGVGSAGMVQLEKDFNTCQQIKSELDLATFLSNLQGSIQGIVQYNLIQPGAFSVTDICATMSSDPDSYAAFVKLTRQLSSGCDDTSFENTVTVLTQLENSPSNAGRSWLYQCCSEFGYWQTTSSPNQPFHAWKPLDVAYFRELCRRTFDGWDFDPDTSFKNVEYGADRIDVTNVVFGGGTIDPWHSLGIRDDTPLPQTTSIAVYMQGTAHCRDLYSASPADPPAVAAAHVKIASAVDSWLQKPAAAVKRTTLRKAAER
jgi:hypothetical protein